MGLKWFCESDCQSGRGWHAECDCLRVEARRNGSEPGVAGGSDPVVLTTLTLECDQWIYYIGFSCWSDILEQTYTGTVGCDDDSLAMAIAILGQSPTASMFHCQTSEPVDMGDEGQVWSSAGTCPWTYCMLIIVFFIYCIFILAV